MIKKIVLLIFIFAIKSTIAQEIVSKPKFLNISMDSITYKKFNQSLETFFTSIENGKIADDLLSTKRAVLTKSQLQELVMFETKKDSTTLKNYQKQLINMYSISTDKYLFSIAYTYQSPKEDPKLNYIINLIATETSDTFTFSVPLDYLTRYWKSKNIGNITYHFRGEINEDRAKLFDKKNTEIAGKLGLKPEKFDFYMCDDFQEISELLGFKYSIFSNGKYRNGYGVDSNIIFSVMNNEDFSHDIFHYYSGQVNKRINRNWITEEGIAYLWGNAYYNDKEGETITYTRAIDELKKYLLANPSIDLFPLFENNAKIFTNLAPEISIRSTISGLIANEIEKKKGMEGILKLINVGRIELLESYLKMTNELIGINRKNFNSKVRKLMATD